MIEEYRKALNICMATISAGNMYITDRAILGNVDYQMSFSKPGNGLLTARYKSYIGELRKSKVEEVIHD